MLNTNEGQREKPSSALQPGTRAPEFTLPTTPDQSVSLTDFRGQPVILAFYPAEGWIRIVKRLGTKPIVSDGL